MEQTYYSISSHPQELPQPHHDPGQPVWQGQPGLQQPPLDLRGAPPPCLGLSAGTGTAAATAASAGAAPGGGAAAVDGAAAVKGSAADSGRACTAGLVAAAGGATSTPLDRLTTCGARSAGGAPAPPAVQLCRAPVQFARTPVECYTRRCNAGSRRGPDLQFFEEIVAHDEGPLSVMRFIECSRSCGRMWWPQSKLNSARTCCVNAWAVAEGGDAQGMANGEVTSQMLSGGNVQLCSRPMARTVGLDVLDCEEGGGAGLGRLGDVLLDSGRHLCDDVLVSLWRLAGPDLHGGMQLRPERLEAVCQQRLGHSHIRSRLHPGAVWHCLVQGRALQI